VSGINGICSWEAAFKKMHESGDGKALMADVFEDENFEEWI
jgi:hypothetical protein